MVKIVVVVKWIDILSNHKTTILIVIHIKGNGDNDIQLNNDQP